MTKRGRKARTPTGRVWLFTALAFAGAGVLLAVAFAARDGGEPASSAGGETVASLRDLHGMAVNPENPREVFLATHSGLVKLTDDARLTRVGSTRDDYMGFTAHPTDGDTFWVSGHPATGGNLGVRVTRDGGATWDLLGLANVDFHSMTVSPVDTQRIWGYWAASVQRSMDGGATWTRLDAPAERVAALIADPRDADRVWAAGAHGVFASRDAGATWASVSELPASALAPDRADAAVLYAGATGGAWKSVDAGASWTRTTFDAGAATIGHLALDPSNAAVVYAGSYDGGIWKSADAGASWRVVRAPQR